jgi:hypothetical protein
VSTAQTARLIGRLAVSETEKVHIYKTFPDIMVVCVCNKQEIFVAVIIDNFKKIKQISNGSAFMTSQQREWVRLQKVG